MADEEMFRSTKPATDSDIADFLNPDTSAYREGTRHDSESRGIFDRDNEQARYSSEQAPLSDPTLTDTGLRDDADHWRTQYGRSENEKGELRRTLAEQQERLNRLDADLAALRTASPAQYGAPPAPEPQQYQVPATFFPDGRKPEDLVEVGEIDNLMRNIVAPAVLGVMQQQQRLLNTQIEATKRSAGITPAIEQKLATAYPWLARIADPADRVQSMAQLLEMSRQPQLPTQQRSADPAAAAARRVTYVEPAQSSGASRDDGVPVEQRIAQEFAAARTSAEKRAVLMKFGAQAVNDWGSNILTR